MMNKLPKPDVRATFGHIFLFSIEIALLAVQFFRMEALAFDLLPELADLDFGFMYGSHLMGVIWLLVVVLLSYVGWELAIRLYEQGKAASGALKLTTLGVWAANFAAMAFEFTLFRMLVDDFNDIGLAGVAELFGLLMVAAHQIASFWIMKNVVRSLYLNTETEQTN